MCSHALTYVCNPSEGIPADVTGRDDVRPGSIKAPAVKAAAASVV